MTQIPCLLQHLSSADSFCKQNGSFKIKTDRMTRSKPFDTLTVFLKEFFGKIISKKVSMKNYLPIKEGSGSVVECLTCDRRAAGSSLTGVTVFCP